MRILLPNTAEDSFNVWLWMKLHPLQSFLCSGCEVLYSEWCVPPFGGTCCFHPFHYASQILLHLFVDYVSMLCLNSTLLFIAKREWRTEWFDCAIFHYLWDFCFFRMFVHLFFLHRLRVHPSGPPHNFWGSMSLQQKGLEVQRTLWNVSIRQNCILWHISWTVPQKVFICFIRHTSEKYYLHITNWY